jgi:RNA polymerase sigma factor (sigma-70 family)
LTELTDEEIIASITGGGDPQKFGILYDRYSNKVYRKCISFTDDEAIAKDLTHDVFIKVFLALSKFKGDSKFSTWLYSITYNLCVDFVNKRNRTRTKTIEDEDVITESMDDAHEKILMDLRASRLKMILEEMKVENKMLLLMKYQDGSSITEIMAMTGKKESAVKMAIKRARQEAVNIYENKYQDE